MNSFKKAMREANKAAKHAFKQVGFRPSDPHDKYLADKKCEGTRNYGRKLSNLKGKLP